MRLSDHVRVALCVLNSVKLSLPGVQTCQLCHKNRNSIEILVQNIQERVAGVYFVECASVYKRRMSHSDEGGEMTNQAILYL